MSLIELMIGGTVGLLILSGAIRLFVAHLNDNRRLLLEARLHQDLRAATDLIARDLRRAGYWQQALSATTLPPAPNPYREITPSGGPAASTTVYSFSRDATENNTIDLSESTGFRLASGALQTLNGGSWQTVTDPGVLRITRFAITPEVRTVPMGHLCAPACDAVTPGCPTLRLRSYRIEVRGEASNNAAVARQVFETVRVRNDELTAATCP